MKYVYKDKRSGNYFICKRINGKMKYFGYYPNKIEAEKALSRLNRLRLENTTIK